MFNISSKNQKKVHRSLLPKIPLPGISPLPPGWKGAIFGVSLVTLFICLVQASYYLGSRGFQDYFVGTVLSLLAILGITGLIASGLHWAKKMPSRYVWFLLASICLLYFSFLGPLPLLLSVLFCIIISFSLLGALVYRFIKSSYRETSRWVKVTASTGVAAVCIFICVLGYWLTSEGFANLVVQNPLQTVKTTNNYSSSVANPADPGPFRVRSITYISDPTYRKDLDSQGHLTTEPVDGSAFVDNWSSRRTNTFGFGPEAMPLNGSVWYPEGDGPFPLVLVVHGNHLATEFSDPGYAYLGKLLASRGFIMASIDENFLNISPYDDLFILDGLEGENRARGWLLLQHLKTWETWNASKGNLFHGKVDMQHIALIGHSRGGEAITTAAAYNQMTTYPEDANIKFDYHFNIKSLVSIAGTDMQYQPGGQPIKLQDINYLSLHGSHDMDVNSFVGANQYYRTRFTENSDYIKSYVYIYGANHGQFNTVWGGTDAVGVGNMLFNNSEILPGEQQIQAAEVLISSFLEATLKDNNSYRMVFQDLGYAKEWLPETMYINNYWDGKTTTVTNYEEDSDPGTTTLPGGRLEGDSLKVWKEDKVKMELSDEQYSAVFLEWDNTSVTSTPAYKVILPDSGVDITDTSTIVFSLANLDTEQDVSAADALVDLTISVEDKNGNISHLPLSKFSPLLPMLEGVLAKRPLGFFQTIKEPIFQNFAFNINDFVKADTNLVPERIDKISFIFDRTTKGKILMKDIGIRNDQN
ncbi:MFS transporter [Bacillus sp. SD088]|uniref:MFS transporter n=1 Tax=Bacillus sp. SD088 TaxID=2782012 RepID=UPI001A957CE1|nr:MFS transporter [Bacillus sp. SD088]MBO0992952.1 MFS transporter [Bacillus sp. SD088]